MRMRGVHGQSEAQVRIIDKPQSRTGPGMHASVCVTMMHILTVGMPVRRLRVPMPMGMWHCRHGIVSVVMMPVIVSMLVIVLHGVMGCPQRSYGRHQQKDHGPSHHGNHLRLSVQGFGAAAFWASKAVFSEAARSCALPMPQ